jgi:NADH dehydrogenase
MTAQPRRDREATPAPVDDRPHVVVLGAGFAGLSAAKAMAGAGLRITVVDRENTHLFVPLLYQVATAVLAPSDIAEPVRAILGAYPDVDVVMGEVEGVDVAARRVRLSDGSRVSYDRLLVATGSAQGYFGRDEWAEHAPGLKTLSDAIAIRSRLLGCFERAEASDDPEERRRLTTVAVVGGGPTGVEMAGAVAGLVRRTLRRDFRRIEPATARVILVEAGQRLLPSFPDALAAYAAEALGRLGVEVRLGCPVSEVGPGVLVAGGERIEAGTIVWGAGVKASPAGRWLGVETDRIGRIRVGTDFGVPGAPGVHAVGDVALYPGDDGAPLPGLAQIAKQQGEHLGRALPAHLLRGAPVPPFRWRNLGNMAVVGRGHAVADFGRRRLAGRAAWLLWCVVHVYLLVSFRNRLLVTTQWLWAWATDQRSARLILR